MLIGRKEAPERALWTGNTTRAREIAENCIGLVLKDQFAIVKGTSEHVEPFAWFCKKNKSHPDFEALLVAHEGEGTKEFVRLKTKVAREGWKTHLSRVRTSDTSEVEGRMGQGREIFLHGPTAGGGGGDGHWAGS